MIIVIEGIIGSGKSTLAEAMSKEISISNGYFIDSVLYKEPVEENPYLEKFYQDQARWALEMQYWLFSYRLRLLFDATKKHWTKGTACWFDRSIQGDDVFGNMLVQQGKIIEEGYKGLVEYKEEVLKHVIPPSYMIYLDATPEEALTRIKKRSRGCETSIGIDYLSALRDTYEKFLKEWSKRFPVIRLRWTDGSGVECLKGIKFLDIFK